MLLRRKILSIAVVLAGLLCAIDAQAQETPAAQPEGSAADAGKKAVTEDIVVTGSRIRRKDLTTPAPVTVLSREQVASAGKVSIADFLQSLPEQGNAINAQVNNGGDGSTKVNLRSLGQNRTLVLVNGRRAVGGGSSIAGTVDLNTIPSAAVERLEILKDGASAVYGSDAVAGVVNIITRRNYNGSDVTAFAGTSKHSDGTSYDLSLTTGTSSDRGNLLFSLGFFDQKAVWAGDRDWTVKVYGLNYRTGALRFSGSSATPAGTFDLDTAACTAGGATPTAACQALINAGYTGGNSAPFFVNDPTAPGGARAYGTGDPYNFEPDNYLYTPSRRYSIYSAGDAALGSFARAFYESSFVSRESDQKLAPEPLFTINVGDAGITYSKDSMYNPYGVDLTDVRRRLVEFGRRDFRQDTETFRLVTGLDGTLPDAAGPLKGWFWEGSFNFGRTSGIDSTNGTLRVPKIAAAIGPSMIDPASGNPICVQTPGDASTKIAGCVPLNLFGGPGSITQDQVAGLGFYGADRYINQLNSLQFNTSGELVRLMADRPMQLALGVEFRRLSAESKPNPITQANENSGNNFQATAGAYNTKEAYGELTIPLLSNQMLIEDLEASIAGRIFNYSTFGTDNTYKVGLRWRPIRDLTIRGTYSTAFRAPTVNELFLGQTDSFPSVEDPCAGGPQFLPPPAAPGTLNPKWIDPTSALGLRCGAAANNNDNRTQQKSKLGGNEKLKPETAKIFTLGAVFEPSFFRGFTATFDFYDIDLKQSIDQLGSDVILNSCYTLGATPQYCQFIHRAPDGKITFIDDTNTNVGGTKTTGLDFAFRYSIPTEIGRFGWTFDGTRLLKFDRTEATGNVIKHAGNYDQLLAMPDWKYNTGVIWGLKEFGAGLSMKYVGTYKECAAANGNSSSTGLCSNNTVDAVTHTQLVHNIKAATTFDTFVSYNLASTYGKTAITLGVQNLFDQKPPVIYNNTTYQSDPGTYDLMGRYMYARMTHSY